MQREDWACVISAFLCVVCVNIGLCCLAIKSHLLGTALVLGGYLGTFALFVWCEMRGAIEVETGHIGGETPDIPCVHCEEQGECFDDLPLDWWYSFVPARGGQHQKAVWDWMYGDGEMPTDSDFHYAISDMAREWDMHKSNGMDVCAGAVLDSLEQVIAAMKDV